jgi:hypothetical protein
MSGAGTVPLHLDAPEAQSVAAALRRGGERGHHTRRRHGATGGGGDHGFDGHFSSPIVDNQVVEK